MAGPTSTSFDDSLQDILTELNVRQERVEYSGGLTTRELTVTNEKVTYERSETESSETSTEDLVREARLVLGEELAGEVITDWEKLQPTIPEDPSFQPQQYWSGWQPETTTATTTKLCGEGQAGDAPIWDMPAPTEETPWQADHPEQLTWPRRLQQELGQLQYQGPPLPPPTQPQASHPPENGGGNPMEATRATAMSAATSVTEKEPRPMLQLPQPVPSRRPAEEQQTPEPSKVMVTVRRALPSRQETETIPLASLQGWMKGKKSAMVVISSPHSTISPCKMRVDQKHPGELSPMTSVLKVNPVPMEREGSMEACQSKQVMHREVQQITCSSQMKEGNRRRKERKKLRAFAINEQVRRYKEEILELQKANNQLEEEVSQLQRLRQELDQARLEHRRLRSESYGLSRRLCESERHREMLIRRLYIDKGQTA